MGRKFDASGNEILAQVNFQETPLPKDGPWIEGPMPIKMGITGAGADEAPKKRKFDARGNEIGAIERTFNPDPNIINKFPESQKIRDFSGVMREITKSATPFVTGLGSAAGAALSGGASLPITALGTILGGLGTNLAMQKAEEGFGGDPRSSASSMFPDMVPPHSISDQLTNAAETTVGNEVGGAMVNKLGRMFGGLIRPQPYESLNPTANRLGPIYKEMMDAGGGPSYSQQSKTPLISKALEDITGGQAKTEQLQNAAKAGTKVGVKLSNKISGQNISSFEDPFEVVKRFSGNVEKTKDAYLKASNQAADTAKNIATFNKQIVSKGKEINGPVNATNTVQLADNFMQQFDKNYGSKSTADLMGIVEDTKKPLVRTALEILNYAKRDKAGNIIGVTPIPFEAAWEMKKAAADLGYAGNDIVSSFKKSQFKNLSQAMDADMESSIQGWKNGAPQALNAYQEAKALVSNRHDLYQQGDEITSLLQANKVSRVGKPEFDAILTDPLKTGKAIAAAGPGGRSDLQAYQIQKILNDNYNPATQVYSREGLIKSWADPEKQAIYKKLYNSDQRQDIGNFIEALSNVSQKQSPLGQFSTALRVGNSAVNIGGALLSGALTASHLTTPGLVVGGAVATSEFTKKVLLNPKIARAATILMNQSPSSSEAKFLSRQIFTALEGVGIALQTKDGQKTGMIENGKIQLAEK